MSRVFGIIAARSVIRCPKIHGPSALKRIAPTKTRRKVDQNIAQTSALVSYNVNTR